MEMQPVTSSNIDSIGYDPEHHKLVVRFNSGATYHYTGVDQDTFDNLMNAESKGKYFHAHIWNVYDYERGD